jgi:hypothetical protein
MTGRVREPRGESLPAEGDIEGCRGKKELGAPLMVTTMPISLWRETLRRPSFASRANRRWRDLSFRPETRVKRPWTFSKVARQSESVRAAYREH